MRFLMLNWRDPRNPLAGGAERVTLAFMRALVERGHSVDWFTFGFRDGVPQESLEGITIIRAGGVLTAAIAARRWAKRQPRFDLVIDQHHGIPWFAPWWCRTRCLAYIHEVLGPIWGAFYRWPISQLGPLQERWTHRLYRKVPFWVPSESTRKALNRHGVREVHVLPNGVDLEPLSVLPEKRLSRPLRLIAVSRIAPNKRVDHAIRAVAELRRRGLDVNLTVVGDGMMLAELKRLTGELQVAGAVEFVGYQPEAKKSEGLRDAHLLLHPSVREGWGLNVIEANAMGTPAVVYPVDGLVDSTVDRETGVICREESPESMAEAVAWATAEEARYQGLREGAWRRAKTFRWSVVIPQVTTFLEKLASNQKLV
ncbi:MAG: glycosyltransferase family 4 protein [Verrucomicrobiales bacterium]|nr:glycosyltransferase family 4 protein [Verrucomicrobiales bacterium]